VDDSHASRASEDQWFPVHLDPVTVRVKVSERREIGFVVPFHDRDPVGFQAA
jgi:hypothetical protein